MSDELLTPKPPAQPLSDPFSNRWGLGAHCGLRVPISTSISEGGLGGVCGASFDIAENFNEKYVLQIEVPFGSTKLKLFPSTDSEGTTADHSHWAIRGGFGRLVRSSIYFSDDGPYRVGFITGSVPMIGRGSSTISQEDRILDGETYSFEDTSGGTWDIGTNYPFMFEFRPWGRGPEFTLGAQFRYGLQYDEDGSDFNRIKLEMGIVAGMGYGDESKRHQEVDEELGAIGITQGFYAMGHGFIQRYMFDKTLTQPMEILDEYGLLGDEGATDRGSMTDVPFLQGASALMSGADSSETIQLRAGSTWFWLFAAARTGGNVIFLASGGEGSKTSGLSGLLGSARLFAYVPASTEEPDERNALPDEEVEQREMIIDLVAYGVNTAVMFIGAGVDSNVAMLGGSQANNGVSMSPAPSGRRTVERTDYGYIPISIYSGSEGSGNRAGVIIHNSWHDVPMEEFQLYSSMMFVSPMMTIGNIGSTASQDEPYEDIMLPTDVSAGLGLEWKTKWTRLSFGAQTTGIFGGSEDAKVAAGGQAGFDVTIPFDGEEDGSGVGLGARATAAVELPGGGEKVELMPWAGATIGF